MRDGPKFWFEGNGPSHFFKFRGFSDRTKKIITDKELYFGSAEDFNDPFDFLPVFTMDGLQSEVQQYLESTQEKRSRAERRKFASKMLKDPSFPKYKEQAIGIANAELVKVRKTTGILCLAARPDHMLLWGHYADSHRGIALRFKPQKGDQLFESACPVTYQEDRPKLSLVQHSTARLTELGLLTKADFWAYEEEWRIIKGPGSEGAHKFAASSLDGIILGAKTSTDHEREIRGWVASAGLSVEWLRASIHKEKFTLNIGPA